MPDAEFFAFEQAILAAERLVGASSEPNSLAAIASKFAAPTATHHIHSSVGNANNSEDCKKRKLPPSFAQQEKQHAAPTASHHVHSSAGSASNSEDCNKRKLPPSFAQQEKQQAPATATALHYKVHYQSFTSSATVDCCGTTHPYAEQSCNLLTKDLYQSVR